MVLGLFYAVILNVYIALNESAVYLQFVRIRVVILFIDEGNFISWNWKRKACAGLVPAGGPHSLTPAAFGSISLTCSQHVCFR